MAHPKSRSAYTELLLGMQEGSFQTVGKDWGANHPDIELPDRADDEVDSGR